MKGIFITLEGVEGCGKTTQMRWIADFLRAQGRRVLCTREPGGPPIAERIRAILLDPANDTMSPTTELLLYEAARAQHVAETIRPALQRGEIVVSDRFADSTTAYQGAGRGLSHDELEKLHAMAAQGVWPDLTVVLDVPVEEGLRRASKVRERDRIEQEPMAFHQKVREGFLQIAQRDPRRVKVVNGMRSPEEVAGEIQGLIEALLKQKSQ